MAENNPTIRNSNIHKDDKFDINKIDLKKYLIYFMEIGRASCRERV